MSNQTAFAIHNEVVNLHTSNIFAPEGDLTYQGLKDSFEKKLDEDGVSEGCKRNLMSALNGWLYHKGFTLQSTVGKEFGAHFEAELESHIAYLKVKSHKRKSTVVKGLSSGSINNKRTSLTKWRQHWMINSGVARSKSLPEALRYLISLHNLSATALAEAACVEPRKFVIWSTGKGHPSGDENSINDLKKIERYCGLAEGTLILLVNPTYTQNSGHGSEIVSRTQYGLRIQRARYEQYKLHEFIGQLQTEWQNLLDLMTPTLMPEGPIKRNSRWFVDPETGECPTADINTQALGGFFGYLLLPVEGKSFPIYKRVDGEKKAVEHSILKGEGFKAEELTLALLSDVPLVKRYIEFMKNRSGAYNQHTSQIINLCCMLLQKETGFLRQQPEYGQRLAQPIPAKKWGKYCANAHERLRTTLRLLIRDKLIVKTRDPEEPIDFIIKDDRPIRYLFELANLMEASLPVSSAMYQRAICYRNMFLVRFITSNPLRIKHFSKMTWRADNTGNLYQDRNKRWWLRFDKNAFKNRKELDYNYQAQIAPSLVPYLEEYLLKYRPLLLGDAVCDYVFRPGMKGGTLKHKTGDDKPMLPGSLSHILCENARKYLRCLGFSAHAYRHIIATDYIKNHRDGLMVAASILHDKPETVLKYYGHYRLEKFHKHWISYHEEQFAICRAKRLEDGLWQ